MELSQFAINVIVSATSWFIGIMIARFVLSRYFGVSPDGPEMLNTGGGVSTDDVLGFDKAELPYIPVKISHEHGLYYAWFANNQKFIGQAEKFEEIEMMAYQHLMKLVGLRMEFDRGDLPPETTEEKTT
jgi:hypothetical protein